MCDKCSELDRKITHYQRLAVRISDKQTQDGIAELIKQIEADKAALRCDQLEGSKAVSVDSLFRGVPDGLAVDQYGTRRLPRHCLMVSEPIIFKCPITDQNVQVRLDDEDAQATEFEGMTCPACTRLHFVNRKI